MKALVTGAGGFIGAHVTQALLDAGFEVRGLDRDTTHVPDGAEPIAADVANIRIDDCDAVFHLAAVYSYARADAALMQAVNVEGTRAVLEAAARTGVPVVHTSSCATCGPVKGRAATEDDEPPAWELAVPYKRTKLDAERLALRAAREGRRVVIVNPTTPVGPGDRRPTPTGKMIRDVASGRARAYLRGGALNIVDVRDVARSHLLAVEHGRSGERYLLGGENLSMAEVFAAIRPARRIPVPWVLAYAAARVAETELLNLDEVRLARLPMRFDDARARRELGHTSRPARDALAAAAYDRV